MVTDLLQEIMIAIIIFVISKSVEKFSTETCSQSSVIWKPAKSSCSCNSNISKAICNTDKSWLNREIKYFNKFNNHLTIVFINSQHNSECTAKEHTENHLHNSCLSVTNLAV